MPYIRSNPDLLLERSLAPVTTNRQLTDAQIDELVAICNPPSVELRDSIAVEFERAALVLRSCRSVAGGRAKRNAFQSQLSVAQRSAKRLSHVLTSLDPDLKIELNNNFEASQNLNDRSVPLCEIEYLLDVFKGIDLLFPPGMKSEDLLLWVIDGLIYAIETRLIPAFDRYSPPKRGRWFPNAKQATLMFSL